MGTPPHPRSKIPILLGAAAVAALLAGGLLWAWHRPPPPLIGPEWETVLAEIKVVMEWTIDPDGRPSAVHATFDGLGSPEVTDCIAKVIGAWTFPRPDRVGGSIVTYPFVFNRIE